LVSTITDYGPSGAEIDQTVVSRSADGFTTTKQWDFTGTGHIDRTESDVTVINLDGSKTETIVETNFDGTLHQKAVVTTSADERTITLQEDTTGAGFYNRTETTTVNVDGSAVTAAQNLTSGGSVIDRSTTTVTADGLSRSTMKYDSSGALINEQFTQRNID